MRSGIRISNGKINQRPNRKDKEKTLFVFCFVLFVLFLEHWFSFMTFGFPQHGLPVSSVKLHQGCPMSTLLNPYFFLIVTVI